MILDVVYNHLGPAGNPLPAWSAAYQAERCSEWGASFNFDGPDSGPVRELVTANAAYWIDEFHLDGLRIDATQQIFDRSPDHVLAAIARAARAAGRGRRIFVVGENEPQDCRLLAPPFELDALWNDDFHHSARVAATGVIEGYLHDYRGTAQELVSALRRGFLYQGQIYPWQNKPRGRSTRGVARHRLIHFLENHDQVANVGFGERLSALTCSSPPPPPLDAPREPRSPASWRLPGCGRPRTSPRSLAATRRLPTPAAGPPSSPRCARSSA